VGGLAASVVEARECAADPRSEGQRLTSPHVLAALVATDELGACREVNAMLQL